MYLFIRVRFLGLTIEGEELWALAASVIHGCYDGRELPEDREKHFPARWWYSGLDINLDGSVLGLVRISMVSNHEFC